MLDFFAFIYRYDSTKIIEIDEELTELHYIQIQTATFFMDCNFSIFTKYVHTHLSRCEQLIWMQAGNIHSRLKSSYKMIKKSVKIAKNYSQIYAVTFYGPLYAYRLMRRTSTS